MTKVDLHNHFFPPEYLEAIQVGPSNVKVTFDADNNPLLHYPGDYNVVVPAHRDIDYRQKVIEKAGVDIQVLSFTTPGTHIENPDRAVELSRLVNDCFSRIMKERGDYFSAFATLPLNFPDASVEELDRAFNELGLKGITLHSNVNGVELSDKRYWTLYEKANELQAVFDIHPSFPVGVEAMTDFRLMPLIGFTFDTTLAAAKLVFSGVVEQFPNIRWKLCHMGGAIPYLAERLDRGYYAFKECRENISKPPSEYLKDFYYDTVNFDINAIQLAVKFAGADHLVLGSDYPHQIGSLEKMVESIEELPISSEEKELIFGGNAIKLLRL